MTRYLVSAIVLVLAVAGLKTSLMLSILIPGPNVSFGIATGLFAMFTVLTAGVAYIAYTRVRRFLDAQRKQKLVPGYGETFSKEMVIDRYAPEWGLSKAEGEVALLAAKGFSNNEIAEMRGSSLPTVKTQLSQIYQKSKFGSRYQLIAFVTEEVCDMATESEDRVRVPTPGHQNVTPLVKKAAKSATSSGHPVSQPTAVAR